MSDDLTGFLRARFDEDEAIVGEPGPVGWQLHHVKAPIEWRDDLGIDGESADTLVLDPARLALEVESKRRILAVWSEADQTGGDAGAYADDVLRALATVYATHPDYRQEWKP